LYRGVFLNGLTHSNNKCLKFAVNIEYGELKVVKMLKLCIFKRKSLVFEFDCENA
jgi:hypothetical protein